MLGVHAGCGARLEDEGSCERPVVDMRGGVGNQIPFPPME